MNTRIHGAEQPIRTDESVPFDASDRAALSEATRWINNAADVLDHLGLVGQLDPQTGHFAATVKSGAREISLQWAAASPGQDPARLPSFLSNGSTPGSLQTSELAQSTASGQAARVEAFLSGLADSTR